MSKAATNRHIEDARIHIPTPKVMAKAAVSEAIAAAWIGNHRTHEGDGDPDDQDMFFEPDGKRRRGEPPVYNKTRGKKAVALKIAQDPELRARALEAFRKDRRSEGDTSESNFNTWRDIHLAWWSFECSVPLPVLPLTAAKIEAVGAALKAAGYRSTYNYMTAATDRHLEAGYRWEEILERAAKLYNASCPEA